MAEPILLISCEHAANFVPPEFRSLFVGREGVLGTHRGYDLGGVELATELARDCSAPLYLSEVTRLLIDCNRSPHNRNLWSEFSRNLSPERKDYLVQRFYEPFRRTLGERVAAAVGAGQPVLHLGVHSFTPVLNGRLRRTVLGLLYDPRRQAEAAFGRAWQKGLKAEWPEFRVRLNYPYRGVNDCHQNSLRRRFSDFKYLALELEVNQGLLPVDSEPWQKVREAVRRSLRALMVGFSWWDGKDG